MRHLNCAAFWVKIHGQLIVPAFGKSRVTFRRIRSGDSDVKEKSCIYMKVGCLAFGTYDRPAGGGGGRAAFGRRRAAVRRRVRCPLRRSKMEDRHGWNMLFMKKRAEKGSNIIFPLCISIIIIKISFLCRKLLAHFPRFATSGQARCQGAGYGRRKQPSPLAIPLRALL